MWGNCENCLKEKECRKVCGIMFGGCTIDYVEKDGVITESASCAKSESEDTISEEVN